MNIMGLLHKAMADAVEDGLLDTNPVPRLTRRSRKAHAFRKNSQPLTLDEVRSFLAALPSRVDFEDGSAHVAGATLRDLYTVWFRTGWRSNQIVALRFDWLSFSRQIVDLRAG